MTEQPAPPAEAAPAKPEMSFKEFLESCPPEVTMRASEVLGYQGRTYSPNLYLQTPDLQLHCEHCDGTRVFHSDNQPSILADWELEFLSYVCRNCRRTVKNFALVVRRDGNRASSARVYKFGELPTFGPPIPSRLISLVGEDRELFLKGRRAELRGLGIGAFAYYRRVVEQQKGRIIEEIGKVAARLGASPVTVKLFAEAKAESQFTTAIEKIKAAIPQSILINGHNPLMLLHKALSEGLHDRNDEDCLDLATSIRLVLTELAERMSAALKDEAELRTAVTKLVNRNQKDSDHG